jgi:hypothetical protein
MRTFLAKRIFSHSAKGTFFRALGAFKLSFPAIDAEDINWSEQILSFGHNNFRL